MLEGKKRVHSNKQQRRCGNPTKNSSQHTRRRGGCAKDDQQGRRESSQIFLIQEIINQHLFIQKMKLFTQKYSSKKKTTTPTALHNPTFHQSHYQSSRLKEQLKAPPNCDFTLLRKKNPPVKQLYTIRQKQQMEQAQSKVQLEELIALKNSLQQCLDEKEVKVKQLREKTKKYKEVVIPPPDQKKQHNQLKAKMISQYQSKVDQVIKLQRRQFLQLKELQAQLKASQKKRNSKSQQLQQMTKQLILQNQKLDQIRTQVTNTQAALTTELGKQVYLIAKSQKELSQQKKEYQQACVLQQDLLQKLNALEKSNIVIEPHLQYLKLLEKEIMKHYYQVISDLVDDDGDEVDNSRLAKLRSRLQMAMEESQILQKELFQACNYEQ